MFDPEVRRMIQRLEREHDQRRLYWRAVLQQQRPARPSLLSRLLRQRTPDPAARAAPAPACPPTPGRPQIVSRDL